MKKKSYREMYDRYEKSEEFKRAYSNKSIGDVIEYVDITPIIDKK